ncbi:hypothetical protein [Brucella rhizosphaerae]|uniref:Uncharacterized protein n=1 Tax=Brucella rhizosphaerae TaxID=571254 RepID=A0A256FL29_9HYPH|nr:hypothetical protein [Brucella rhizosphaerae]OYR15553.1 hypothetical protein CEV32_4829 [Brucella rhizosphaerae]
MAEAMKDGEYVEVDAAWLHARDSGEFIAPTPTPQVVSRFQARAALFAAGLLPQVENAISEAEPLVQMAWSDAQEFRRDSPTILALANVIGLTENQVDQLFTEAFQIVA